MGCLGEAAAPSLTMDLRMLHIRDVIKWRNCSDYLESPVPWPCRPSIEVDHTTYSQSKQKHYLPNILLSGSNPSSRLKFRFVTHSGVIETGRRDSRGFDKLSCDSCQRLC